MCTYAFLQNVKYTLQLLTYINVYSRILKMVYILVLTGFMQVKPQKKNVC